MFFRAGNKYTWERKAQGTTFPKEDSSFQRSDGCQTEEKEEAKSLSIEGIQGAIQSYLIASISSNDLFIMNLSLKRGIVYLCRSIRTEDTHWNVFSVRF